MTFPVMMEPVHHAHAHRAHMPQPGSGTGAPPLRLLFWETTKACNLSCHHCRAIPQHACAPDDLSTRQGFALMDAISEIAKPVLILSGGEPLYRRDIFELGGHGASLGFRMALATNGTLVDREIAERIAASGFQRVAISLDGANPTTHDRFRGVPGAHARAVEALTILREEGVSIQINSSIAKHNVAELPRMLELALELGADALHIFMLVPVGCGLEIAKDQMLPTSEYEQVLHWFYDMSKTVPIDLKATCAPHYFRVRAQRILDERKHGDRSTPFIAPGTKAKAAPDPAGGRPLSTMTRGCLAGTNVCFISHRGDVYPCGYLPVSAGNVLETSFPEIWKSGQVFRELRNPEAYGGKCGECRYMAICGGCRARAYGVGGDYMAEEPFCVYDPAADQSIW
jgi:heme b synthase